MGQLSVSVVTLGCAKNAVDSDIMKDILNSNRYNVEEDTNKAEVIIINTCGFIEAAKQESINTILDLADLKQTGQLKYLIVAGCLAQRYKEELLQEIPEIDGIVGTGNFSDIHNLIEECKAGKRPAYTGHPAVSYDEFASFHKNRKPGPSAFVKISEGCNNHCTFCIIPSLRGEYRSRTIESIYEEVVALSEKGTKEINLVAQDSSLYGFDIYGKPEIAQLLRKLNSIDGIEWIRLLYTYPGNLDDELIDAIADLPKVCKYVEIPLQHSEPKVLKLMNRPGQNKDIKQLISSLRNRIPDVTIRTTIIVGFPNESNEDFENLKQFVAETQFDRLGVFTYSKEEGTAAAKLTGHIEHGIKEKRAAEIMEIQRKITELRNSRHIGKVLPVLIERAEAGNTFVGRTQYDAPEIDSEIYVTGESIQVGEIVPVKITHALDFDFSGEVQYVKPSK
ncbi:30S ribosomal protein S12 methylthiotransferase RimO [Desulfuribacillus alkaliarsenatis]|uniref:Ribosomal protein uS12 methylthiotransferase RimO n=1 Tax=Desulfuribacillus alkaliarsenatis TaxID=766136 RepID=A0A1E5G689_9FIRM|nr:30S ribosomal protein S12 methylthiotransferase RimO [Desulfuribacillus alkaliarsenatis]OEF98673.1 ribosomal protein S12 methylthiotransferase RimO [Desulfuribacillus alkaliarsenatis]